MVSKKKLALLFFVPLTLLADEVPIQNLKEVKQTIENTFQDVLSTWTVSTNVNDSSNIYLRSPMQRVEQNLNFCMRKTIVLPKDEFGKVEPFKLQDLNLKSYASFAINSNNLPCENVIANSFFTITSMDGSESNIAILNIAKDISGMPWLDKTNKKYEINFEDDEARACLSKKSNLFQISSINELQGGVSYLEYKFNLKKCEIDNERFNVELLISEPISGEKYTIISRAYPENLTECIRKECYRKQKVTTQRR